MQQPPNPYPQYPQQQWQQQPNYSQPQTYYPPQQQWQQPPMLPQQQWSPQQPPFPPQRYQQPPSRRKRNSTIWLISGVIACMLLIIVTAASYALIRHSSFLGGCSLSSSVGNSTSHVTLASTYHGALAWGGATLPMSLNSVNENQQGAICGTLVLGTVANNSHPFTGTVIENNITFTATLAGMTTPSTFTGAIGVIDNASIQGGCTDQDGMYCGSFAISPE